MADSRQSMMAMAGSSERSLEMVLKYLHSTGEIVWYHDNEQLRVHIFHRPETLIKMLRAVFRHDFDDVVTFVDETGQAIGMSEKQFDKMKRDFLSKGVLTRELLKYLLLHFNLVEDTSESLLNLISSLMLKFDLCFELKNSVTEALIGSTNIVQFPWFFPLEEPDELPSRWTSILPRDMFELRTEFTFSGLSPPNFFEKLSVKLHSFLSDTDRLNWKHGVFAEVNKSRLLVKRETVDSGTVIVASVRGASDLQELWGLIRGVRSSAVSLFHDWPLLKCEVNLVCSHCLLKGVDDPHRYPGLVLETALPRNLYAIKSCDKFPDELVPTCFVFPMEEINYQDNHQEYMKAATEFMASVYENVDVVDGEGPSVLSDHGLAFIACRLGYNWSLVALNLGISQSRIEQIQMSYPQDAFQQIIHALIEWRDADMTRDPNTKIQQLLDVLTTDAIGQNELADALRRNYNLV